MVYVIATIEVDPQRVGDFLAELRQNVPNVRGEAGCLQYEPTVDAATDISAQIPLRRGVVTIVEQWQSLAALQDHLKAPHMTQYRQRVKEMIRGVSLQVLERAPG